MKHRTPLGLNQPLLLPDHPKPRTRREMIAQGFRAGVGTLMGGSIINWLAANPAHAALSQDLLDAIRSKGCGINASASGAIPFICFDLAGGANIAGSNVLVGGRGGQLDFLSTAGYRKLGLPGDQLPNQTNALSASGFFYDNRLGLAFHSDSALLKGIIRRSSAATWSNTDGCVIAARSENDTGNNPHNPMYGINRAGANGSLLALVGSRASESGGNSMAPAMMINNAVRPTKIDRPSDARGLVDVGDLVGLLAKDETVAVMESMYRLSLAKLGKSSTGLPATTDAAIKKALECGYLKSAYLTSEFGDPNSLDPLLDDNLKTIFTSAELSANGEYAKAASVMKLVTSGYAGAGTITMGGFDYHTGDRVTGEMRDFQAGECIGACLEYARLRQQPLMIYVFSDGSVFSNGDVDEGAGGKLVWTGDNQQTAASFFLVYNPTGRPTLARPDTNGTYAHRQLGYMAASGDVDISSGPAANNVNLLVETVILNYMALNGKLGQFAEPDYFPRQGLGSAASLTRLAAFAPLTGG
jgi:hypothetical protein